MKRFLIIEFRIVSYTARNTQVAASLMQAWYLAIIKINRNAVASLDDNKSAASYQQA